MGTEGKVKRILRGALQISLGGCNGRVPASWRFQVLPFGKQVPEVPNVRVFHGLQAVDRDRVRITPAARTSLLWSASPAPEASTALHIDALTSSLSSCSGLCKH